MDYALNVVLNYKGTLFFERSYGLYNTLNFLLKKKNTLNFKGIEKKGKIGLQMNRAEKGSS